MVRYESACSCRGRRTNEDEHHGPSPTVVIMLRITQSMLPAVCRGHPWLGVDANGALATTPGGDASSAPRRGPGATRAAPCRARSAGEEAAAGLEPRPRAVLRGVGRGFLHASHAPAPPAAPCTGPAAVSSTWGPRWTIPALPGAVVHGGGSATTHDCCRVLSPA
jgi:hypothetical protein